MKIALDMQSRQTAGSRERGIGRYSLSLALAMLKQDRGHRFTLLLNGVFGQTVPKVLADFGLEPGDPKVEVYQTLPNSTDWYPEDAWRHKASEFLRESYVASRDFDFVHCTSLFESPMDDSSTSWGQVENRAAHAVTLYDLIPYAFADIYLNDPPMRNSYLGKVQELRKADLLLAISEFSRSEAIGRLGVDPSKVVNIAGAADDRFAPRPVPPQRAAELLARHGLGRFVMYTGGIDYRKNIEQLIRAYARLPRELIARYQLVIVCSVQKHQKETLLRLAAGEGLAPDRLVMTGFVSDEDLVDFYNLCDLFVFPSWCEGFGLPALEAMQCGVPVIAAGTSSLPEVVGLADALFDPYSVESMTAKIAQALSDEAFRATLREHGLARARTFTWDHSATLALDAMEAAHARRQASTPASLPASQPARRRPKLAFVSPLPPSKSGIAGYSAQLLPFLDAHYEITLVCKAGSVEDDYLAANFDVRTPEWLRRNADRFDRVLYQFGNSDHHDYMFRLLEAVPGTIVLHDFWMSNVLEYIQLYQDDPHLWDVHMHHSHGWAALSRRRGGGHDVALVNRFPCNLRLIESAHGVIVHSAYSARLMSDWYGPRILDGVELVSSLKGVVADVDKASAKHKLGLDPATRVVCSFGFIHSTKHSARLANAFLRSRLFAEGDTHLVLVGQNADPPYGDEIARIVGQSKGRIRFTGFVSDADYALYLSAADAAVQLRGVSRGETSAAALDCLAYGVALVINDNGAFSQIPDEAAIRIPAEFEDAALVEVLDGLLADQPRLDRLRQAGRDYLRRECDPAVVAAAYQRAIERFDRHGPVALRDAAADRIARFEPRVHPTLDDLEASASALVANFPKTRVGRVLYVDERLVPAFVGEGRQDLRAAMEDEDRAMRTELLRIEPSRYVNASDAAGQVLEAGAPSLPAASFDLASGDTCLLGPRPEANAGQADDARGLARLLRDARMVGARVWAYWPDLSDDLRASGLGGVSATLERLLPHVQGVVVADAASAALVAEHVALGGASPDGRRARVFHPRSADPAFADVRRLVEGDAEGWEEADPAPMLGRAWYAGHQAIFSETGTLEAGAYRNRPSDGYLVYGPYADLPAGDYVLRILGELAPGAAEGSTRYEVVADKGETVVATGQLGDGSYYLAEHPFTLDHPVSGLEVRVWASASVRLAIRGYYLAKTDPTPFDKETPHAHQT